jgi:NAD(P)-dependent dehydrogenase (short-subunit alcohol dehydrogenase family)
MIPWNSSDIPLLYGRSAVVTGTGGLGFACALALARAGASVILAGRNAAKGRSAVEQIHQQVPGASLAFELLDLASIESVRAFSARLGASQSSLDLLINNAGVMTPPLRRLTADGFELQLGTNHLGHFALTAGLLPLLRQSGQARVVTVSSIAAARGLIDFHDLQAERAYRPMKAYSQSKLACLMFALELQRRSQHAGWGVTSMAAHPGVARTDLLPNGAGAWSVPGLMRRWMWFLFQPAAQGALPALYAATSPDARGGAYYGPDGPGELRGRPTVAKMPSQAMSASAAERLWSLSEKLTGAVYPAAAVAAAL